MQRVKTELFMSLHNTEFHVCGKDDTTIDTAPYLVGFSGFNMLFASIYIMYSFK